MITDSNNVQVVGSFFIDTNSVMPGNLVSQMDTCIAITGYISANVTDVYTDYLGNTYAEWTIVLANYETVVLNVQYLISTPGYYTFVLYLNCNGDKSTVMLQSSYNVMGQDLITSVNDLSFINSIQVYPNPINNILNISFNSKIKNNISVRVYDILGKSLFVTNENIESGVNSMAIDFSTFDRGVYLIQIKDEKMNVFSLKVVK